MIKPEVGRQGGPRVLAHIAQVPMRTEREGQVLRCAALQAHQAGLPAARRPACLTSTCCACAVAAQGGEEQARLPSQGLPLLLAVPVPPGGAQGICLHEGPGGARPAGAQGEGDGGGGEGGGPGRGRAAQGRRPGAAVRPWDGFCLFVCCLRAVQAMACSSATLLPCCCCCCCLPTTCPPPPPACPQAIDHNRHAVLMTLLDAYPLVQVRRCSCSSVRHGICRQLLRCAQRQLLHRARGSVDPAHERPGPDTPAAPPAPRALPPRWCRCASSATRGWCTAS